MKKGRNVILLFISILSGISAAFFIVYYLNNSRVTSTAPSINLVKIAASSQPIDIGEAFNNENVSFMSWPKNELPANYVTALSDLSDMVAASRIPKGIPITKNLIVSTAESLANLIPQNYRAMTVDMTQYGGIPEFIEIGSYVDVIATFDKQTTNPISKTILQNVKVLKIARRSKEKSVDRDTLTLVMSVGDAEKLSLAMAKGSIRVTLRNQGDIDSETSKGIDSEELLWGNKRQSEESTPLIQLPRRETVEIIRGVEKKVETLRTR
ncbi:MAG: Flp pilus assembly protein CpaB [Candidatus Omnitrophica bacterium]|nr:Flp pilus assembly protein CpaB [Candidatus Omnitrophota bacterium]